MTPQAAPLGLRHRISSDGVWPLRAADGRTWAERKTNPQRTAGEPNKPGSDIR